MIYKIGKKEFDFSKNYYIMGILNVTPDSFYSGSRYTDPGKAIDFAQEMIKSGADIIDIGGESSRPGAETVSIEVELERVLPIIEKLSQITDIPISIDTCKSQVADECLKLGASVLNDISGLTFDPEMVKIAARYSSTVIINHIKGTPKTMQQDPYYENVIQEISCFFEERIAFCKTYGIRNIILDPGIGFGKKTFHNLQIFNNITEFKKPGYPILIGPSRKRFIGEILKTEPENRLLGTAASVAISIYNGANIIRVHDVCEMKQVAEVAHQIKIAK